MAIFVAMLGALAWLRKMKQGVGMLLAEIMRIKAEGDYDAIKALIDKYGVHFDPAVRDQIVPRYKKLNLPTYWAGVNPELSARMADDGSVMSVAISYPENPIHQYLSYGAMYDPSVAPVSKTAGASAKAKPPSKPQAAAANGDATANKPK